MNLGANSNVVDNSSGGDIETGANSTVNLNGDASSIINNGLGCTDGIHCDGISVTGSQETVNVDNGSGVTVNGDNNAITSAGDATFAIDGDYNTLTDQTGATGDTIAITGNTDTAIVSGASITVSADDYGNVFGGENAVTLGAGDAFGVFGGGTVVNSGAGDLVYLSSTTSTFDSVNATGDQFGNTANDGQGTGIFLDSNTQANLVGSADSVGLGTGDSLGAYGGGNSLNFGAGNVVFVSQTGGNFDTLNATGVAGGSTTANGQGTGIVLDVNAQANLAGSNDSVSLASGDSFGAYGGGNVINAGAGEDVFVSGTDGASDTINATGDQNGGTTANGQGTGIGVDSNADIVLNGSQDTLSLSTGDAASVYGGSNTVASVAGDLLYLSGTNTASDIVNATGDAFGSTTGTGQGTGIFLDNNAQVSLFGNANSIGLGTGDSIGAYGGGNDLYFGSGNLVVVGQTGNDVDTLYANGDLAGATTANGQATGISLESGADANVTGNGNDVSSTGATVDLTGNNNNVTTYAGSVTINGTGDTGLVDGSSLYLAAGSSATLDANSDTTNSTGAALDLTGNNNVLATYSGSVTINGTGDTGLVDGSSLYLVAGSSANLGANSDTTSSTGAALDLNGNNNVLATYSGSVTINGTGDTGLVDGSALTLSSGSQASLTASSDQIALGTGNSLSLNGASNTIGVAANANDVIAGSGDTISGNPNDVLSVIGNNDTVSEGGASTVVLASGSQGDTVNVSGDTIDVSSNVAANINGGSNTINFVYGENGDTIYANGDTIRLASYVDVNIVGSNNIIDGSVSDTIIVNGINDPVSADQSSIGFTDTSNTGDTVTGSYDAPYESGNWAGYDDTYVDDGLNDETDFSDSGAAAGIVRTISVVAQYDLSHGLTTAAITANLAWSNAQQAIAAATNPTISAPNPFNGIKWTGPVVTWSFATGTGTPGAPLSGSIQAEYQPVIERAMQTWEAATGLIFVQAPDSSASNIRIGWGTFDTPASGTLGYATALSNNTPQVQSVLVRLEDPAENSLVTGADGTLSYSGTQAQLYQVALHEIGHALGLAETSDPNSVLFPELGPANTTLDATDTTDIDALYHPAAVSGSHAAALLTQAMASFNASLPAAVTTLPPAQIPDPTLAANAMH